MSIEVATESRTVPTDRSSKERSAGGRRGPGGSWWKFGLAASGAVALLVAAAAFLQRTMSVEEAGPKLTHTIARGDLVVTVTEQGTLESSNNTEIKCKVRGYSTVIWVIEGGTEVEEGDELVRLDTKAIEDAVSLLTTNVHTARAELERSKAEVAKAEIAIPAYLEGTYRSQMKSLEKGLAIAEANLVRAKKNLEYSEDLFAQGYVNQLKVEADDFLVTEAELELKVKQKEIEVLEKYTKEMELETLRGNLTAARSKLEADTAGLAMDQGRLDRALEELEQCVIRAERSGLVIYPSAAQWKETPDITEGATVRKDQVLLLMPDLTKMQVKVGIHESMVDRVKPGQAARVTLPDRVVEGTVSSVSAVTRPAGWWTGNVVKYDTIIELPPVEGLKPGMSAEVEVILDRHEDVVTVPVAAVVGTAEGDFCWVKSVGGAERRPLRLGDTDDSFLVVEAGLAEGEQVVLNPLALVDDARREVMKPADDQGAEDPAAAAADEAVESLIPEAGHGE